MTDLDRRRAAVAVALNERLAARPLRVLAGVRKGPYTLILDRLSRRDLERVIRAVEGLLGWGPPPTRNRPPPR